MSNVRKKAVISISLDPTVLEKFDEYRNRNTREITRSELIEQLIRHELGMPDKQEKNE